MILLYTVNFLIHFITKQAKVNIVNEYRTLYKMTSREIYLITNEGIGY